MLEAMAKKTVEVEKAQEALKELVEQAVEGNEVVLTQGQKPVVRLVPIDAKTSQGDSPARIAGLHPGNASTSADFDDPLPEDFWSGA